MEIQRSQASPPEKEAVDRHERTGRTSPTEEHLVPPEQVSWWQRLYRVKGVAKLALLVSLVVLTLVTGQCASDIGSTLGKSQGL